MFRDASPRRQNLQHIVVGQPCNQLNSRWGRFCLVLRKRCTIIVEMFLTREWPWHLLAKFADYMNTPYLLSTRSRKSIKTFLFTYSGWQSFCFSYPQQVVGTKVNQYGQYNFRRSAILIELIKAQFAPESDLKLYLEAQKLSNINCIILERAGETSMLCSAIMSPFSGLWQGKFHCHGFIDQKPDCMQKPLLSTSCRGWVGQEGVEINTATWEIIEIWPLVLRILSSPSLAGSPRQIQFKSQLVSTWRYKSPIIPPSPSPKKFRLR